MHTETTAQGQGSGIQAPGNNHKVNVFFKNDKFEILPGIYTTEQLIALFPIEPGYLLNLKTEGELVTLLPEQKITVKNGMHFFSQVPGGGSS